KGEIARVGDPWEQPRAHGFTLPFHQLFGGALPLGGMLLNPLLCQRAVELDAGVVESQLDDGNVRAGRLREIAKLQLIELQLSSVELIEAVAEMQQQQIGLVSEQRVERALALLLRGSEGRGKFLGDFLSLAGVQTFPL